MTRTLARRETISPPKPEPDEPPIDVNQTARELNVLPPFVRILINGGVLDAVKINGKWAVSRASVRRRIETVRSDLATNRRPGVSDAENRAP